MEIEDVKANRSKKAMLDLSLFEEKFITEGNEKADEPAREVARLEGRNMAQVRAIPIQWEREEVHAALQYAASLHCLVEDWEDCEERRSKPEKKGCVTSKRRSKEALNGVLRGNTQMLVHGMRKAASTQETRIM